MVNVDETASSLYSRQVGGRLRMIRKQKRLSLHDVELRSQHEFKASVLGAYERGERVVSVPRLDRLSEFYGVPIDQLLPRSGDVGDVVDPANVDDSARLVIDIAKLAALPSDTFGVLTRYLRSIQVQRQDFSTDVVRVRGGDLWSIAAMLDVPIDRVSARLAALGALSRP